MNDQRPTKKQRELLSFIDGFIKGNGYGPSYREVMRALDYKSVSTVSIHIDGLITRGYLRKKTRSARSLEVVDSPSAPVAQKQSSHEAWLRGEIEIRFKDEMNATQLSDIRTLAEAAKVLGFDDLVKTTLEKLDVPS